MALVVQKFGGTSVANIKRIKNVAKRAAKTYDQGNDVVIILSAMAGVTDGLVEMANRAGGGGTNATSSVGGGMIGSSSIGGGGVTSSSTGGVGSSVIGGATTSSSGG